MSEEGKPTSVCVFADTFTAGWQECGWQDCVADGDSLCRWRRRNRMEEEDVRCRM